MATYTTRVEWAASGDFASGRYSREHTITFDGGVTVPGSSSTHIVPLPWSVEAAVDPEEMFVAALSTCHMLWFLDLARREGLLVESYDDDAEGVLAEDSAGRLVMTEVTLRPRVVLAEPADAERLGRVHHAAHQACFLANSVTTTVVVTPRA